MSFDAVELTSSLNLNNVLESEWQSEVFLPFFIAHENQRIYYHEICSNINLLHYLLSLQDLQPKLDWDRLSANK